MDYTTCLEKTGGLILDGTARYPFLLKTDALSLCTGQNEAHSRIGEAIELGNGRIPKL